MYSIIIALQYYCTVFLWAVFVYCCKSFQVRAYEHQHMFSKPVKRSWIHETVFMDCVFLRLCSHGFEYCMCSSSEELQYVSPKGSCCGNNLEISSPLKVLKCTEKQVQLYGLQCVWFRVAYPNYQKSACLMWY